MQSISVPSVTFNWRIGLTWMAGAFVAWVIGIYFFFGIGWGLAEALKRTIGTPLADTMSFIVAGLVFGAILGVSAWVVFQRWASSLRAWVVLSAVGFGVGASALAGVEALMHNDIFPIGGAAVIGLALSTAQWMLLRRMPQAGWWIVANTIGVALAFWCAFTFGGEGREGIALLSSGAAYAVITAVAAMGIFSGADSTEEHVVN